jgi:hypothetical protein
MTAKRKAAIKRWQAAGAAQRKRNSQKKTVVKVKRVAASKKISMIPFAKKHPGFNIFSLVTHINGKPIK